MIRRVITGDVFDAGVRKKALDGLTIAAMVLDPNTEAVNDELMRLIPITPVLRIPHERDKADLYSITRKFVVENTQPGDIVLDPFAGFGTTQRVCEELGRGYVLIEIIPELAEALCFVIGPCKDG